MYILQSYIIIISSLKIIPRTKINSWILPLGLCIKVFEAQNLYSTGRPLCEHNVSCFQSQWCIHCPNHSLKYRVKNINSFKFRYWVQKFYHQVVLPRVKILHHVLTCFSLINDVINFIVRKTKLLLNKSSARQDILWPYDIAFSYEKSSKVTGPWPLT